MQDPLTSLPNLITYGRVVAVPIVCALLVADSPVARWTAVILFILASVSDFLDGYLARRMNLNSALGRMLDPIADKLLVGAVIVTLAYTRDFSALDLVPAIAILGREILVSGLREYLGPRNIVVHVTALAKWKTTLQLVALTIVMLEAIVPGLSLVSDLALWLAAAITVWTGFEYFRGAWPHLRGAE